MRTRPAVEDDTRPRQRLRRLPAVLLTCPGCRELVTSVREVVVAVGRAETSLALCRSCVDELRMPSPNFVGELWSSAFVVDDPDDASDADA